MREPTNPRPGYPYGLYPSARMEVEASQYQAEQMVYTAGLVSSSFILGMAIYCMAGLIKSWRRERRYRPSRWAVRGGYTR